MQSKRVLLIDDESSLRRTLGLSLLQQGYETEPCANGVDALKKINLYKARKKDIDFVVCDIQLPDIDGMKLYKIIKKSYPELPVIMITGFPDKFDNQEFMDLNVDGYIQKPLSAEQLVKEFELLDRSLIKEDFVETVAPDSSVEKKSEAAYMCIKLKDDADMFDIYRNLYFDKNALYCDMTTGEYDIIMLAQADSVQECRNLYHDRILKIDGVKEVDYIEVSTPVFDDNLNSALREAEEVLFTDNAKVLKERNLAKQLSSYVLLQVDKEKLEEIYPTLYLHKNVVYCDYSSGKYNLVLLMQGSNFGEIEKVIEEKINNIDGILKVKKFPIISGFENNF